MFKRNKIEVIAPWTDDKFEEEKRKYKTLATRKDVVIASALPIATSVGFAAHQYTLVDSLTPLAVNAPINGDLTAVPTGFIADKSLEVLATIMDPFIEILVTVSFPVASLIMTFAFFIMMFGMKEKALSMIMNAGLGYVLVQMLPLFNQILRSIGEAV